MKKFKFVIVILLLVSFSLITVSAIGNGNTKTENIISTPEAAIAAQENTYALYTIDPSIYNMRETEYIKCEVINEASTFTPYGSVPYTTKPPVTTASPQITDSAGSVPSTTLALTQTEATPEHGDVTRIPETKFYPLPGGFLGSSLEELRAVINFEETAVVKYYDPDESEFLPYHPPFLKIDIDNLFRIFEIVKKYEWQPTTLRVNVFVEKGIEISVACMEFNITDLVFSKDSSGRGFVVSIHENKIAYLSDADFNEIKSLVDAAPEWPEMYFKRYGYYHFSEYPR